jgi:hypothetical protein
LGQITNAPPVYERAKENLSTAQEIYNRLQQKSLANLVGRNIRKVDTALAAFDMSKEEEAAKAREKADQKAINEADSFV